MEASVDGSAGETGSVSGAVGNESKVKFGEGEVLLLESWRTGLARALPCAHTGAEMHESDDDDDQASYVSRVYFHT